MALNLQHNEQELITISNRARVDVSFSHIGIIGGEQAIQVADDCTNSNTIKHKKGDPNQSNHPLLHMENSLSEH